MKVNKGHNLQCSSITPSNRDTYQLTTTTAPKHQVLAHQLTSASGEDLGIRHRNSPSLVPCRPEAYSIDTGKVQEPTTGRHHQHASNRTKFHYQVGRILPFGASYPIADHHQPLGPVCRGPIITSQPPFFMFHCFSE